MISGGIDRISSALHHDDHIEEGLKNDDFFYNL
jgi:hypothetical protein